MPKSKSTSAQPETHVELKKEWAQTLPLIYDEDSVLDRNEVEVWVRSFNSAIKTADDPDDYDLYMQHLFVLFCVLSLNVLFLILVIILVTCKCVYYSDIFFLR